MSKRVRFTLLIAPIPVVLLLVWMACSVVYVPAWYKPAVVTEDQHEKLLDELTEFSRQFNNGMQHPKEFTLTLTEDLANRLIAGREYVSPELRDALPKRIVEPAVAWRNGWLYFGSKVRYRGHTVLANIGLRLRVSDDKEYVELSDVSIRIGAMPVPASQVESMLADTNFGPSMGLDADDIDRLIRQRRTHNSFKYAGSDYRVRLLALSANDGKLTLTILPIDPD